jgi:multiple sugar transport system substrate-binding protein
MITLLGEDANLSSDQIAASKSFAEFWLSGDPYRDTITMIPGALMPTIKGYEDAVLNTDLFSEANWGQALAKDQLAAVEYGDEMGIVNGTPVPALGTIQANSLIGEACFRIAEGDAPDTVAKEQAQKMREALS